MKIVFLHSWRRLLVVPADSLRIMPLPATRVVVLGTGSPERGSGSVGAGGGGGGE